MFQNGSDDRVDFRFVHGVIVVKDEGKVILYIAQVIDERKQNGFLTHSLSTA